MADSTVVYTFKIQQFKALLHLLLFKTRHKGGNVDLFINKFLKIQQITGISFTLHV